MRSDKRNPCLPRVMGTKPQIVGDKFLREFGGYPEKGWQKKGEKCVAEFWGKNRCAKAGLDSIVGAC